MKLSQIFLLTVVSLVATTVTATTPLLASTAVGKKSIPSKVVVNKKTSPPQPEVIESKTKGEISLHNNKEHAVTLGSLCAFNSGFVNACFLGGFLTPTKQGTIAVTGAWTNFAIFAAQKNWKLMAGQVALLVSFITGSLIYGLLTPTPKAFSLPRKQASTGLFLATASMLGAYFVLTTYGSKITWEQQFLAFSLIALASGIQNSLTSSHSANLCRSTHYTGSSSDMGTLMGHFLRGNHENLFKFLSLLKLTGSFWLGGFLSTLTCVAMGNVATPLLISATIEALLGLLVLVA